jgi:hypothetical protein
MKKLLFILLFIPLTLFSQETKEENSEPIFVITTKDGQIIKAIKYRENKKTRNTDIQTLDGKLVRFKSSKILTITEDNALSSSVKLFVPPPPLTIPKNSRKNTDTYDLNMGYEKTKKLFSSSFNVTKELILKDKSKVYIGDTIRLGESTSKISTRYQHIVIGRPTVGGALLGITPIPATTSRKTDTWRIKSMKVYRGMGKVDVKITLRETDATGLEIKYLTASDIAFELGELINPNAPLTRAQAIAKLKESKDLLDLGLFTQEEYDELKKELTPIIMNKNN